MKAIHACIRTTGAAFLVLAVLFGGGLRHAGAASGSQSLAGHWVAHLIFGCNPGVKGETSNPLCALATRARGAVTLAVTMDIVSNDAGSATFQAETSLAGTGSGVSPQCDAKVFVSSAFKGICPMTSHGKGSFMPVTSEVSYFWVTDEWVTFYGKTVVRKVHNPLAAWWQSYPEEWHGWPIPAVPGYHHDYLPGHGSVPTGIHVEEVVARY